MAELDIRSIGTGTATTGLRGRMARIGLWVSALFGLYLIQEANFLLFHGLAELFSIVIAGGVFLVAWNSRKRIDSNFLLVVGTAYAFIAVLDGIHMLAYSGMGVFPEHGPNLPTQLWIAARYLETASLVVGTAFIGRNVLNARVSFSHRYRDIVLLVLTYAGITTALLAAIFLGAFPAAYLEGVGLTTFKVLSEYVVIGLLGTGLGMLYRHRAAFEPRVFQYLAMAMVVTIGAEFAFTLYVSVYGLSNVIGHLLKIASFYLIYLAIIKTGISAPQELLFRQLKEERNALAEREAQLERQNERLDDFASIVSHDLRNPLSLAQSQLELAQAECDSERLATVGQAHERMETLIDDLLLLARTGNAVTEVESVDIGETVVIYRQTVATEEATIQSETERTIRADTGQLQQLVENLIRNAVEHGGEGVTVTVGDLDSGFYIEDDGPGIPQDEREQVFEASYTTSEDGSGLGLSIVKQVVDAHDWEIRVTDSAAGGARFEITGVEFDQ